MITWDISSDIISLGPVTIRWYGLLFAGSFIVGLKIMSDIFKKESRSEKDLNDLVWYMIIGTVVGARLGHCLFYNPEYYFSNPIEILKIYRGGLASHGAAIGILLAIYLFVKRHPKFGFLWIMDRVVITVALAGFMIRMGNLFNSEIIGKATDVPWAFTFLLVDNVPRHPAQLYEAIACIIIFVILYALYQKKFETLKEGYIFGLFLIGIFGFRFFVEFFKENQSGFEENMMLNMGQILSIPLVIAGVFLLFRTSNSSFQKKN